MKFVCGFGRAVWIVASKGRTSNETQSNRYQHGFAAAQKVAWEIRQAVADFGPGSAANRRGPRHRRIFLVAELPEWPGLCARSVGGRSATQRHRNFRQD